MLRRLLTRVMPPWTLSAACCAAILYLTLWPDPLPANDFQLFPGADKAVHAIMMMGMTLCLGLDTLRKKAAWRADAAADAPMLLLAAYLGGVVVFGGAIELLQDAMHLGRSKDLYDLAADAAGAAVGWGICAAAWGATARWLSARE